MSVSKFNQIKTKTLATICELIDECNKADENLNISARLQEVHTNLSDEKFTVAVVGVIKRGKSTLLNALLKADTDILSTQVTPETARLSTLKYSPDPKAIIHTKNKKQIEIRMDELPLYTSTYTGVNPKGIKEKVENTLYAEIYYPNKILQSGITIVDTPGVDDPDVSRSNVTLEFISEADAAIFLIDPSEGGLKDSELKFLKSRVIGDFGKGKGIIGVCNKIGTLRKFQLPEVDELIRNNKKTIKENCGGIDVEFYKVDSAFALQGYRNNDNALIEKSGYEIFREGLENYLVNEKGKILLIRWLSIILIEIIKPLLSELKQKSEIKPVSITELKEKIRDLKSEIDRLKIQTERELISFQKEKELIVSGMNRKIADFFSSLNPSEENYEIIPDQILRFIGNLSKETEKKLTTLAKVLQSSLEKNEIKIIAPNINFSLSKIDPEKFVSTIIKESEVKSEKASVGGAIIGGVLGFLIGGPLGGIAGATAGGMLGSAVTTETVRTEEIIFDLLGYKSLLSSQQKSIKQMFKYQVSDFFDSTEEIIKRYFESKYESADKIFKYHSERLKNESQKHSDYLVGLEEAARIIRKFEEKFKDILIEAEAI